MFIQDKNEYGVITIDDAVFNQILKDSLKQYEGRVWFGKYEGKRNDAAVKLGNFDSLHQYDFNDGKEGKILTVYLIAKFGDSLGTISNHVIKYVYESLSNDLELKIENVIVIFTGLISTKGIIKRDTFYSLNEIN